MGWTTALYAQRVALPFDSESTAGLDGRDRSSLESVLLSLERVLLSGEKAASS